MTTAGRSIHFGVGCFVFEVANDKRNTEWKLSQWADEVKKAIGSLSNVSQVDVSFGGSDRNWTPRPALASDFAVPISSFEPAPYGARITFEIAIPRRLHSDLLKGLRAPSCERFRVETIYGLSGPYTFVTNLDDADDGTGGSNNVVLLWRFLKREIPKCSDTIQFVNCGPSPFHAVLSLVKGPEDQVDDFAWRRTTTTTGTGYTTHEFWYSPSQFATPDQARKMLYRQLGRELTVFYGLVRDRNFALWREIGVQKKAEELVAKHQATGFKASLVRLFRSGGLARRLGLDALQAQVHMARMATRSEERISRLYAQANIIGCFEDDVRSRLVSADAPNVNSALEVVRFVEGGRSKELEVLVVASSTVLGALAGAAASVIAR